MNTTVNAAATCCECPTDGFCERYQRQMGGRLREICRGENIDPAKADAYRANWIRMIPRAICSRLREPTGRTITCEPCGGTRIKVFRCAALGECTIARDVGVACCASCGQYLPRGVVGGEQVARFDHDNLAPGAPHKRFNASIIADPNNAGRFILAYRDGWAGSEIHLVRLNEKFQVASETWRLSLYHAKANYGREDPRLFMHNGRLHVAYIGVAGRRGRVHTNVLYARLSADCSRVEDVFFPRLSTRNPWEKNWSFFSSGGELYAVYSISPHRILRLVGESVDFAYTSPTAIPWRGGEMRGGASPVLVGNEWWSFFHDRLDVAGVPTYRTGLYTFDAEPPFAPRRYAAVPLLSAEEATRPADQYAAVVFTCGATPVGDDWVLSSGIHDRWTELHRFSRFELERRLRVIGSSSVDRSRGLVVAEAMKLAGWCTQEKAEYLFDMGAEIAATHDKPIIVEVGVFAGRSFLPFAAGLDGAGVAYAIDPWSNDAAVRGDMPDVDRQWWGNEDLLKQCQAFHITMRQWGIPYTTIQATAASAADQISDATVSAWHVDGNHDYDHALADFKIAHQKLRPGGILVVDDVEDSTWIGVDRALFWVESRFERVREGKGWRAYRKLANSPATE